MALCSDAIAEGMKRTAQGGLPAARYSIRVARDVTPLNAPALASWHAEVLFGLAPSITSIFVETWG